MKREEEVPPPGVSPRPTGDGSLTLYSDRYDQTFHSHHGAVRESQHVFLEGSGVAKRLAGGEATSVLEVGFGTGLNFFLSAQAAVEAGTVLHYVALEGELLPANAVEGLGYEPFAPSVVPPYLEFRRQLAVAAGQGTPGMEGYRFQAGPVELTLLLGEATAAQLNVAPFDAVYHDAFSPDANPELWAEAFLGRLANALRPGGTLVTYTVKGEVRRTLARLGLEVTKRPGPQGGKREMLRADRPRE